MKVINKNKLKLKHLIGIQTEAEYEPEDMLYDIIRCIDNKGWTKYTNRTIAVLKWIGVSKCLPALTYEESLAKLIELGWLESSIGNGTVYYSVVTHPW
jgi:hypothetical protein